MPGPWTLAAAESHLLDLELFGMSFGLERMRALMGELGEPQRRFAAIHVVGTNGKSSTTHMIAAILERHGVRTGAYTSPHLRSFTERVQIAGRDIQADAFAAAVERVATAEREVNRRREPGDVVTQFEALTAAAYVALAQAGVEVAVVEAGLGGRYDATNVLDARVVVLTSIGLEHTRWLGPTLADIAAEKLAVVSDGATLVTGPLDPEPARLAREAARRHDAHLVEVTTDAGAPWVPDTYQRVNFALARAAAAARLGELDDAAVASAAADVRIPGRLELIDDAPPTILDGAHNPDGLGALMASLPALIGERPLVAVVSVLEDKDADAMLRTLLPHCTRVVVTSNRNPRALTPATLESLVQGLSGPPAVREPDPHVALRRARELATPDGAVLATGSIYLVADLLDDPGAQGRRSTL